jgi:hypothetical protein
VTSTNTTILTGILLHALIPFGMGHGPATIGLLEAMLIIVPEENHSYLVLTGVSSFAGQLTLLGAGFTKPIQLKKRLHIAGLLFLWLSILFLYLASKEVSGLGFGLAACSLFILNNLYIFTKEPALRLYNRLREKLI